MTQEKRTEIADLMKGKLNGIDTVDFIEEGENKFFVKYKEDGTVSAREEEIVALLGEMGYKPGSIDLESDIERQMDLQYFETRTLVEQDVAAGTAASGLAQEWEEYQAEKLQLFKPLWIGTSPFEFRSSRPTLNRNWVLCSVPTSSRLNRPHP